MEIIRKYKVSIVIVLVFITLTTATFIARFSVNYVRAQDMVAYLNSDMAKTGVRVEDASNKLLGENKNSAHREWSNELKQAKKELNKWQTICIILASLSIIALGAGTISILLTNEKTKPALLKFFNKPKPRKEEKKPQVVNYVESTSNADELKKFKDLLDSGIITQEEFDQKKKQLLGL